MSGYKRKRDDDDDDSDQELSFQKQILPVADLPHDFNAAPADGMQYLFMVRRDARALPHITRASNPYEIDSNPRPRVDSRVIPNHIVIPSAEWRSVFETRFKRFRQNVNQPAIGVPFDTSNVMIPAKKERDAWWAFLAGKPESAWIPRRRSSKSSSRRRQVGGTFASEMDQDSWQTFEEGNVERVLGVKPPAFPTGSPVSEDFWESNSHPTALEKPTPTPREPRPCILRHIDQQMALHLLMYFTHWINLHVQKRDPTFRPVETHARWMFALLSKVGEQLSADDMCLLRNLARACIGLLKDLSQKGIKGDPDDWNENGKQGESMGMRSCWIIIGTVAGVWGQRDLWQDAEDGLKTPLFG